MQCMCLCVPLLCKHPSSQGEMTQILSERCSMISKGVQFKIGTLELRVKGQRISHIQLIGQLVNSYLEVMRNKLATRSCKWTGRWSLQHWLISLSLEHLDSLWKYFNVLHFILLLIFCGGRRNEHFSVNCSASLCSLVSLRQGPSTTWRTC